MGIIGNPWKLYKIACLLPSSESYGTLWIVPRGVAVKFGHLQDSRDHSRLRLGLLD